MESILIYPTGPEHSRGATLVEVENDRWLLTLAGYHDDHPGANMADFMDFAKHLPQPDIFEAVKDATALSEIILHKFPYGFKRQYGKIPDFPTGIFPLGDINASLNPLFGQGMSSAFLQAEALDAELSASAASAGVDFLTAKKRYFKRVGDILKTPWDLALGEDFRFSRTKGDRPAMLRVKNILKGLITRSSSIEIIEKFYSVVHLIEKQGIFYHPLTIIRLLARK